MLSDWFFSAFHIPDKALSRDVIPMVGVTRLCPISSFRQLTTHFTKVSFGLRFVIPVTCLRRWGNIKSPVLIEMSQCLDSDLT